MRPQQPQTLAEAVGGVRGVIDSAAPTVVFVSANSVGGLRAGLAAAVITGVLIMVLRLVRREPVRQALGGFGAVAVAAAVAARTGSAQGFFLPGILLNAGYAALAAISVVVGHPFVGYVLAALDDRFADWRHSPPLRRAATLASLVWTLVFAARAAVQGWLYLHSQVGWLAAAKLGMGLPLFAAAAAVSLLLARRAAGSAAQQHDVVAVDDLAFVRRTALGGQLPGGASQEGG